MNEYIRPNLLKRIHVDQHAIRANTKAKNGPLRPPLTVQTSYGPIKGFHVQIDGPSELVYRPNRPLSCGARLWIETRSPVVVGTREPEVTPAAGAA